MPRTRIKICGIRDFDAAEAAIDAGADAIGFVFARNSPRYIDPEDAQEILFSLPPLVSSVGVFMNHSPEAFADIEETCPTTHSQLHGNEEEKVVSACGPVIKAIKFAPETIVADLKRWEDCPDVEAIMIDGQAPGSGEAFDWSQLAPFVDDLRKPVFLAGGLTPENVGQAIAAVHPYAVDVSSGVERERGVKDAALIEAFCEAVRRADAQG